MNVIDPGHSYELAVYDGDGAQSLIFMKREGDGYPFNVGHHAGTNCQEVIRVLIDRVKYLNKQIPCDENLTIICSLRSALIAFETRAARRHRQKLFRSASAVESIPSCSMCGHIACKQLGDRTAQSKTETVA